MIMLFISLFKWWYGAGWVLQARALSVRLDGLVDYFSIDLLAKTLFAPFRQDGVGRVDGPLEVKFRAFLDKLISRILGAIIRTAILLIGLVSIALFVVYSALVLAAWFLVPVAPVIGIVLAVMGVHF